MSNISLNSQWSIMTLTRIEKQITDQLASYHSLDMSKIDGNISGVGFGTLIPFRGWWYPLYPRFLSTFNDKLIARRKGR